MKILIAGGSGFIGQALIAALKDKHQFTVLTRDKRKAAAALPGIDVVSWADSALADTVSAMDAVINLVGENIGEKRWSKSVKDNIIGSRVKATTTLCQLIRNTAPDVRPRLLNASAIGIYGLQPDITAQQQHVYTESSDLPMPATDFLSAVGLAWEAPLSTMTDLNCVRLRFGVVLHPSGGMLKKVMLPFKLGMGGRIGSGKQPFSWIALEDVVAIIEHLLAHPELSGAFNLVAPDVVSQHQFACTFARHLHRPSIAPMPAVVVRCLFGQMGEELLLSGQHVASSRLAGFPLKYQTLDLALSHWFA